MEEKKEVYVSVRKKPWKDLEDNDYIYKEGNIYPREGLEVNKKRIKELSSTKNKIGEILIQKAEITEESKSEDESDEENQDDIVTDDNELEESEKSEVENDEKLEEDENNAEETKIE